MLNFEIRFTQANIKVCLQRRSAVWVPAWARMSFSVECMFSPCLHGFPLGALVSLRFQTGSMEGVSSTLCRPHKHCVSTATVQQFSVIVSDNQRHCQNDTAPYSLHANYYMLFGTNTFELKYYLNKKKIKKSLAFPGHQIHWTDWQSREHLSAPEIIMLT